MQKINKGMWETVLFQEFTELMLMWSSWSSVEKWDEILIQRFLSVQNVGSVIAGKKILCVSCPVDKSFHFCFHHCAKTADWLAKCKIIFIIKIPKEEICKSIFLNLCWLGVRNMCAQLSFWLSSFYTHNNSSCLRSCINNYHPVYIALGCISALSLKHKLLTNMIDASEIIRTTV